MVPMNTKVLLIKEAAKDIISVSYHSYLHWNKKLAKVLLSHAFCYLVHVSIAFYSIDYAACQTIVFLFFGLLRRNVEHYLIVFIILYYGLNHIFTFALFALSMNVSPFETRRLNDCVLDVAVAVLIVTQLHYPNCQLFG